LVVLYISVSFDPRLFKLNKDCYLYLDLHARLPYYSTTDAPVESRRVVEVRNFPYSFLRERNCPLFLPRHTSLP
jgi:hypothetical protein